MAFGAVIVGLVVVIAALAYIVYVTNDKKTK